MLEIIASDLLGNASFSQNAEALIGAQFFFGSGNKSTFRLSKNHHFQSVAVKKLSRPFHSDIHAKRTYRELRLLKHFRHENVISMLNVFSSNQTFDSFNELYFVTHLMGSDLNNIIRTQRLTDDHVRFLTYQVL